MQIAVIFKINFGCKKFGIMFVLLHVIFFDNPLTISSICYIFYQPVYERTF